MQFSRHIDHCSKCGTRVKHCIPQDDNRQRPVCPSCGHVHYVNPLNVVGTLPVWDNQVLLCKRNIEPRKGFWTLPAGFMELGETTAEGALRETDEEAGANIELLELYSLINVVPVSQVHFYYRARLLNTDFRPGPETIEVNLFDQKTTPWDKLAFGTVKMTLERFFEDQKTGRYTMFLADLR